MAFFYKKNIYDKAFRALRNIFFFVIVKLKILRIFFVIIDRFINSKKNQSVYKLQAEVPRVAREVFKKN